MDRWQNCQLCYHVLFNQPAKERKVKSICRLEKTLVTRILRRPDICRQVQFLVNQSPIIALPCHWITGLAKFCQNWYMDFSKLINGFVKIAKWICHSWSIYFLHFCQTKQRFQNLLNESKYSVPFGSVVPLVMFWILSIWSSYFTYPSLPFHPFFLMGLDMIYLRWYTVAELIRENTSKLIAH